MGNFLRVLIVEDSEDDALLVIRQLKKDGFDPEYERVQTAEAMRNALRETLRDVILCDFKLPAFSGLHALALLKEMDMDIPFIIVSGVIDEVSAVAAMNAGAHDYVMKDHLARLAPAIERELKEVVGRRERREAVSRRVLIARILNVLNGPDDTDILIRNILLLIKNYTGIEAIGIRLSKSEGYPYYETNGFTPHFLEGSKDLCRRDISGEIIRDDQGHAYLECMCGNIIAGRTDSSLPFFTEGGSFWTNSLSEFMTTTTAEEHQTPLRNHCLLEGYESVALIPLHSGDKVVGLLQLNDQRRDFFKEEAIRFYEEIGASIGIAVNRLLLLESLRKSGEELLVREELLNETGMMAKIGGWEIDCETREVRPTKETFRIHEISEDSAVRLSKLALFYDEPDRSTLVAAIERCMEKGEPFNLDLRFISGKGRRLWIHAMGRAVKAAGKAVKLTGTFQDITDRKQAEDKLQASLREKEILLKEIHHRVKNNLQVVSSLLNLQSASLTDKQAIEAFKASQNHVSIIAKVHEMLYRSENLVEISYAAFIEDLANNLLQSYGSKARTVSVRMDIQDVSLDIDSAIPCGLIVNELVTNALKHAFPESRGGEIIIGMRSEDNRLILKVKDNGIGFPEGIDFRNTSSLGLQLVSILVKQLKGTVDLAVEGGTTVIVTFPEKSTEEQDHGAEAYTGR